ncbi:MAG TPA: general secretion pathway protein GspB [Gammaproteobacteria bacterium]|jgi:hypothetical protein
MSLILDALRKSERTRQQSLTGQLGVAETPSGPGRLPVPWVTLIGILLVVNGLLLFFFWPRTPAPVVAVAAPTPAAPVAAYHPSVRPLSAEAGNDDDATATAPAQPELAVPSAAVIGAGSPDAVASLPAQSAPQVSAADTSSLTTFDALPADLRSALPTLHMDVHGYVGNAKDRFVVINLKQYHIGDVLDEGPTLKDIVPQGAVLEFRGTTFLLPAY